MDPRQPRYTITYTLFPYTTLFRSRAWPVRAWHLVQRPVASAAARSVSDAGEQGYERTEILFVPVVKPARPQGSGAPGNAPATDHHQQHAGRSRLERHGLRTRAGSARTGRPGSGGS